MDVHVWRTTEEIHVAAPAIRRSCAQLCTEKTRQPPRSELTTLDASWRVLEHNMACIVVMGVAGLVDYVRVAAESHCMIQEAPSIILAYGSTNIGQSCIYRCITLGS